MAKTIRDFLLDGETETDAGLYIGIGRAVILWGNLEHNFSNSIARLYHQHGGDKLVREPPFGFKRKIEFWNRCFLKLPHLAGC